MSTRPCPICHAGTTASETQCWACLTALPPWEAREAPEPPKASGEGDGPYRGGPYRESAMPPEAGVPAVGRGAEILVLAVFVLAAIATATSGACGATVMFAILALPVLAYVTRGSDGSLRIGRILLAILLVILSLFMLVFLACATGAIRMGPMH